MRVIGIDTASGAASVALVENGLLLSEKTDLRCESARDATRPRQRQPIGRRVLIPHRLRA